MTAGDEHTHDTREPVAQAPAGESAPRPDPAAPGDPDGPEAVQDDVAPARADEVGPPGDQGDVDPAQAATQPPGDVEVEASGLEEVQAQLAERTADLQRLQAELVNYRRRVERDRDLVKQNATFSALTTLMPVLDDVDRAREAGEVEGGFKAVADSLERAVSALGLVKYGATGEEFDPNLHEALMHGHSSEVTTTTVDKVVQAGYRINDRVVRAAKVTVLDPEG